MSFGLDRHARAGVLVPPPPQTPPRLTNTPAYPPRRRRQLTPREKLPPIPTSDGLWTDADAETRPCLILQKLNDRTVRIMLGSTTVNPTSGNRHCYVPIGYAADLRPNQPGVRVDVQPRDFTSLGYLCYTHVVNVRPVEVVGGPMGSAIFFDVDVDEAAGLVFTRWSESAIVLMGLYDARHRGDRYDARNRLIVPTGYAGDDDHSRGGET